jgi:PAS domain S-box-containing protein
MTHLTPPIGAAIPWEGLSPSLFDLSPAPTWAYDDETLRHLAINDSAVSSYGYSRERFLAMSLGELRPAEANPNPLATPVEGVPSRCRLRRADGSLVDVELAARRIAVAGRPAWLVTASDVGDQIRLEQALAENHRSEQRLRQILEAASDWFWETDAKGFLTYVSPNYEAFSGLCIAENLGRRLDDVDGVTIAPEMAEKARAAISARQQHYDFVYSHQIRPGERARWIRTNCLLVLGEDGALQGFRGASRDITAQVEAEAALRRGQQHLAHAQRVSGVGSALLDPSGIDEWSDELYRILGLEPGTVLPSVDTFMRYVHEEDRPPLVAIQDAVIRGEAKPVPEYRVVRDDGSMRVVQSDLGMLHGDDGRMGQLLITFRDVTELRAAEARARDLEQQLQHARKLEALGTLAGGVAHDLNNTLVPVLSLSKLTMRRLSAESREYANLVTIHKAGERARDLVQQILAFSRKEAPTRERLDLAALLRDSLGMVRASLPATIRIEEVIDEVPPLLGVAGQLHQIVLNLVVNAAQAIGDKMGTLSVVLRAGSYALPTGTGVDAMMPAVKLSVSDSGHGMDEATMRRIFEPFFTTKAVGEGTGLGLSVVHGIIAQHGGRVTVASKIGEGTQFDVFLPTLLDESEELGGDVAAPGG